MSYKVTILLLLTTVAALAEEKLPLLEINGDVYTNVTVLRVTATDIHFAHSQGIGTAKLKNLNPDLQRHFNYAAVASPNQGTTRPTIVTTNQGRMLGALPYLVTPFETPETKEKNEITSQARALFAGKDYDKIEAFAKKLRESKDGYANGYWKLNYLYDGFQVSDEASETEWSGQLSALRDWIKVRPRSITACVAYANALTSYAWKARGSGWADTVTDKGWELFAQRLNEAAKTLSEAKKLQETCPVWATVLQAVTLGLGAERSHYDRIFREAVRTQPNYARYYFKRAFFLLPRWHGKIGEWEEDLKSSADQIGGEDGDLLYARVVWSVHDSRLFTNVFKQNEISWPRVDKGFAVMEKRFPDSFAAKSERAYLAALARDKSSAREYFDRLQGKADTSVWKSTTSFSRLAMPTYGP